MPTTSPTRPGYTFSYWSTSPDGSAYTFGGVLLEDTTLYAVWAPEEDTAYTVVFWKQSVNDDKTWTDEAKTYDYAESLVRYAETGSTVWPTDADGEKNYQGFHYNDLKSTEVEVNGDGTTILNVYYDRNPLTIDFRIDTPAVLDYNDTYTVSKPWSWPHPSPPAAVEGYQWYDTTRAGGNFSDFIFHYAKIVTPASDGFQFTGLYGQTLAQNGYTWPSENRWRQNKNGGNTLTFLDSFIFDDLLEYGNSTYITVYGQAPSTGAQIIHYKEALDGTWVTANTIQTKGGTFYFSNKYTGFTVAYYSADSGSWKSVPSNLSIGVGYNNKLEVRHTRNSYDLAFYSFGVVRTESLKFEAPLVSFAGYEPSKPAGLPDVYEFKGWFKDEAFSEPFNFASETMPSNDLMIYAKWAPPVLKATIHQNVEGTGSPIIFDELPYEKAIHPDTMPIVKDHQGIVLSDGDENAGVVTVPEHHTWIGWAKKVGDTYITYNFNTILVEDIVLYPYYVDNRVYSVSYFGPVGESSGPLPVDHNKYAKNSFANIMSASGLTPPSIDQVFLGWSNGGIVYRPGDKIKVTDNMQLFATWGPKPAATGITYNPNGATGEEK